MIRIRLPEAEAQRLEAEFRSTEDRKLRDRLQVVLLAHKGRKHQDIAADLCINRRSVQRWLSAYCERGLAGLVPRKARRKDPGIPASLADEIRRWVIEGPAGQGLDRANWTHEELADHLRHVGRMYPKGRCKRVVLTIDNAPWHRGPLIDEALAENPHLEFYPSGRLPLS